MAALQPSSLNFDLINKQNDKNKKIINPVTGGLSFGIIDSRHNDVRANTDVYLRLGFKGRTDDNKKGAFGARHIWDKHRNEFNLKTPDMLPDIIASITENGADILFNKQKKRPIILNTHIGMIILEEKNSPNNTIEYSIVTAYSKKDPTGILIGELKSPV